MLRPDERPRALGRRLDVHRLGRDHDQVGLAGLGRVRRRPDRDDAVAARPLDAQAVRADRLDVLRQGSIAHTSCPALPNRPA